MTVKESGGSLLCVWVVFADVEMPGIVCVLIVYTSAGSVCVATMEENEALVWVSIAALRGELVCVVAVLVSG